jgi:hypothetical protein
VSDSTEFYLLFCALPIGAVLVVSLLFVYEALDNKRYKKRREQAFVARLGKIPTDCELCGRPGSPIEARYKPSSDLWKKGREWFVLCPECWKRRHHQWKASVEELLAEVQLRHQPDAEKYGRCAKCGIPVGRFGGWELSETRDTRVWCIDCKGSYPTWIPRKDPIQSEQLEIRPQECENRSIASSHTFALPTHQSDFGVKYRDYLSSSDWQSKRRLALERAGNRCQLCASRSKQLEVHHNSYKRLGHEEPEDLIVLCRACHQRFHDG